MVKLLGIFQSIRCVKHSPGLISAVACCKTAMSDKSFLLVQQQRSDHSLGASFKRVSFSVESRGWTATVDLIV